ncbi:hypothetical protein FRC10_000987 [Ceratobasidium sp. 414]|nr:hypothetical protein FRC10_000987 [Ceratobasidium sp. 414]
MFFSPGEFLHQFSGMGMNGGSSNESGPRSTSMSHMRPSPLGRSLTIAPDTPLAHPHPNQGQRGLALSLENHRTSGVNLALEAKNLRSPTFPPGQVDPTYPPPPPGPNMGDRGPFVSREQQQQHSSPEPGGQYQLNQVNLTPEQRALVGGGFGSDTGFPPMSGNTGYETEMRTPPGFDTPPDASSGMENGMEGINSGRMGSSGQASPMLFAGVGIEGDPSFDLMTPDSLAMAMIGHEYAMPSTGDFTFP